jgi:cell division protein FtsB
MESLNQSDTLDINQIRFDNLQKKMDLVKAENDNLKSQIKSLEENMTKQMTEKLAPIAAIQEKLNTLTEIKDMLTTMKE